MPRDVPLSLYDPRLGEPSLTVRSLDATPDLDVPRRSNCFTVIWVHEGDGTFWADLSPHCFKPRSLLFLAPYQLLRLVPDSAVAGVVMQFHANFFCIETHHQEVGCNGVLFNDPFGVPVVRMDAAFERQVAELVDAMRRELEDVGLAHSEVLLSYLKILLVRATRLRLEQQHAATWEPGPRVPAELEALRQLLDARYRELHKPSQYAELLHLAPKTLTKLVKAHLHKTPTELIRERLVRQAKWELLHTTKPVKQVAFELGFEDVFYFSRLFKRATGCSPSFFREYETEIRGGRNLAASPLPGNPSM
jgi:AraC family transcriptional regulator, transcriptional activator of pobA